MKALLFVLFTIHIICESLPELLPEPDTSSLFAPNECLGLDLPWFPGATVNDGPLAPSSTCTQRRPTKDFCICTNCTCGKGNLTVDRSMDNMIVTELIAAHGLKYEVHYVTTADGYILTLHRIPNYGRPSILLWHGILCSVRDWFIQRGCNSLAIMLWNAGYDVWMVNMRGNDYSMNHTNYTSKDSRFWNFSYDEMAKYDFPACIDYVLSITGETKTHVLGYSLGTTVAMAGSIYNKTYQDKIKTLTLLAPVASNGNATAPAVRYPAQLAQPEEPLGTMLHLLDPTGIFTPRVLNLIIRTIVPCLCRYDSQGLCPSAPYFLLGPQHKCQYDPRMGSLVFGHWPSTTSQRTYTHVIYPAGKPNAAFQMYNYQTPKQNQAAYNSTVPPYYNLQDLTIPTLLLLGEADQTATLKDGLETYSQIGTPADKKKLYIIENKNWTHLDFI